MTQLQSAAERVLAVQAESLMRFDREFCTVSLETWQAAQTLAREVLRLGDASGPSTPTVLDPIHQACIDMLEIVFSSDATDDERRAAAITIVEAVAPDVLVASLPPEIQKELL